MSYFRFFPDVIWVQGKVRSTLYELSDHRVTHLSYADTEILISFSQRSIEKTKELFSSEAVNKLLKNMIEKSLGSIYNGEVYAEPYLPHMPFELKGYLEPVLIIDELTLELYPKDIYGVLSDEPLLIFQGCNSCIPSTKLQDNSEKVCDKIISELSEIDEIPINRVKLHIGSPYGHYEKLRQILNCCSHGRKIEIEFVLYMQEISDELIRFVSEYENSTIVICCSDTECKSEKRRIMEIVDKATEYSISTVLSVVFMHHTTENTYPDVVSLANSLGIQIRTTELLRDANDFVFSISRGENRLESVDGSMFYVRSKYSACKYGKLSINCNGVVSGCLHDKAKYFKNNGLFDFLTKNGHKQAWELPKCNAAVCKECENRFACIDCCTIEHEMQEHPEYINMICGYKMRDGIWSI